MSGARPTAPLEELWAGDFAWRSAATSAATCSGSASYSASNTSRGSTSTNARWRSSRERVPGVDARLSGGAALPFADNSFDLVFTMGVLIHQDPETQLEPMVVRCSRQYMIADEYFAHEPTEVPYRGQQGALFKQDFGALYQQLFPPLELISTGHLGEDQGRWDDVPYWVFKQA